MERKVCLILDASNGRGDRGRGVSWWIGGKESAQNSPINAGCVGSIPASERFLAEGNSNPPQYSCLENPMDRGVWQAAFHGVTRVGHDLATKPPLPTWPKDKALKKPNSLYTFNLEKQ